MLLPMGRAAIAHVFLSLLRPGDHVLLGETVYGPARAIALNFLGPRGIACEFYPGGQEEVAKRLRPSTRLVYLDNPGSIVYDIQDVPALAWRLKGRDTLLAVDNTWGCPRPLSPAGARGGSFGGCDHQVCRRSFRSRHGGGGGGPPLRRPALARCHPAGPDGEPGRGLQCAERSAQRRRATGHAHRARRRSRRLAETAAAGQAHSLSASAGRSGTRLVAARLQGRQRPPVDRVCPAHRARGR